MCGTKQNASKAEALDSAGIQTGKKRRKAGEPMAKVKGTRGYKSYHGRSGGKKLLVILLVLVLAAATVACPPAVPVVVSGEVIGPDALEIFRYYGIREVSVMKE